MGQNSTAGTDENVVGKTGGVKGKATLTGFPLTLLIESFLTGATNIGGWQNSCRINIASIVKIKRSNYLIQVVNILIRNFCVKQIFFGINNIKFLVLTYLLSLIYLVLL